jgi:hypothetical protein
MRTVIWSAAGRQRCHKSAAPTNVIVAESETMARVTPSRIKPRSRIVSLRVELIAFKRTRTEYRSVVLGVRYAVGIYRDGGGRDLGRPLRRDVRRFRRALTVLNVWPKCLFGASAEEI